VKATLVSKNPHKARELERLLPGWEIEPLDVPALPEETGATFYDNALAKALYGRAVGDAGTWMIGEDSGLEVEGLDGRPGIRSARYAGAGASDEENTAKLLAELADVAGDGRRGRYVSELVCIDPGLVEYRGSGTLAGRIAAEPRGSAGFGYDPVFVPEGEERTVAELGDDWKARRSHRAAAAAALRDAVEVSGPSSRSGSGPVRRAR
jgi:XTP/dITP diphosphohydrolase